MSNKAAQKYFIFAKIVSSMFFLMYGIVPFFVHEMAIFNVYWALPNLYFSLIGSFFVIFLKPSNKYLNLKIFYQKLEIKNWQYLFFFVIALIVFWLFPWHDDRESAGASFAALMRATWLIVIFKSINKSERFRLIILLCTLVLMFIDESRTYFIIMLLILAARSKFKKTLFVFCIFGVILLGATRMDVGGSIINKLTYGLIGEAYNATKPVGQILLVSDDGVNVNTFGHLLHTFLQPFIFPVEIIIHKFINLEIPTQSSYFSDQVSTQLQETLSPMGGWYIVADFIYYGVFGVILMLFYLQLTWWITNFLLNTNQFPFGAFLFIISIKATPYIYYKFIFYILIVKIFVSFFKRFKV